MLTESLEDLLAAILQQEIDKELIDMVRGLTITRVVVELDENAE